MGAAETILVADDEFETRSYFETALAAKGYGVELADDGDETLAVLREGRIPVALVLLDIRMPNKGGFETLREIRSFRPDLPVILMSGASHERLDEVQEVFLEKPVLHERLFRVIYETLHPVIEPIPPPLVFPASLSGRFAGRNSHMRRIDSLLRPVGFSDVPVLLQGETGVGKEVLARQLHAYSRRATQPFLKLNCAALPFELVESELFGYQRGAFTGAFRDTPGKFEMAQGGTIFLDEIGDMDTRLQAKLLQVLQDSEFQRLGSGETVRVDVRVMAATHRDLREAIRSGQFREDLYYRLNVITMRIPPLRERNDEIPPLAEHFLHKHCPQGMARPVLSTTLQTALQAHDWPGNVRELENMMRKLLVFRSEEILLEELGALAAGRQAKTQTDEPTSILDGVRMKAEREAALKALEATQWNRKQAARLLNIDYKVFLYKMKKLGLDGKQKK